MLPFRESDQKFFVSNNSEITEAIDWTPTINFNDGISSVINNKLKF